MYMYHGSNDPDRQSEKYSSAISLADMEIFVFPELLFSLVLANIMSPIVWSWRDDPWFKKIDKMSPYRRITRLRQFIMDRYEFNLDLDTWGLTTKDAEIDRFKDFIDMDILSKSNALFGYEGDKYYFDLDIRKHFGLDKYTSDVIPFWKTETVEAMEAFAHREGYDKGAGECVSLSTLYAAALYVVCDIPLEDIFMLATPLHSQNFVLIRDGIITNNRRIVTKNMWFNGTELTAKAQRALRNEQVTIVANNTGHVHTMYPEATIDRTSYDGFAEVITEFLKTPINMEILCNFLRQHKEMQNCFQIKQSWHGKFRYIEAEKVYAAENTSNFRVSDPTVVDKLLEEIDEFDFYTDPLAGRIILGRLEIFFQNHPDIDLNDPEQLNLLLMEFGCTCGNTMEIGKELLDFIQINPKLPHEGKDFVESAPVALATGLTRDEVVQQVSDMRKTHPVADLAFYAYRDMASVDWAPFLKAALQRNSACVEQSRKLKDDELAAWLNEFAEESVYDGNRLAQPDEVWNFKRGDGIEKAITFANIYAARHPGKAISLAVDNGKATVETDAGKTEWRSGKTELSWSGPLNPYCLVAAQA